MATKHDLDTHRQPHLVPTNSAGHLYCSASIQAAAERSGRHSCDLTFPDFSTHHSFFCPGDARGSRPVLPQPYVADLYLAQRRTAFAVCAHLARTRHRRDLFYEDKLRGFADRGRSDNDFARRSLGPDTSFFTAKLLYHLAHCGGVCSLVCLSTENCQYVKGPD